MYLADRLKMTLTELRRMPQAEYVRWAVYHAFRAQRAELANLQAQARSQRR